MIDPYDTRTPDLVDVVDPRPALRLVDAESAPAVQDDVDGPLDAAARQRRARRKRKQLADEQGLKAVWLTEHERTVLGDALRLAYATLSSQPALRDPLRSAAGKLLPGVDLNSAQERAQTVDQLCQRVAALEQDNALLIGERGRAHDAVEVLQRRLQRAGLVSDYRRQPGE